MIEIMSRHSLAEGFRYLLSNPIVFLYNAAIIMLTLSLSLAFKRRYFVLVLFIFVWAALGFTNFILLGLRTTPLAAFDFQVFKSVQSIIFVYLTIGQLISLAAAIVCVLAGIAMVWIKAPKQKPSYLTALLTVIMVVIFLTSSSFLLHRADALSSTFGNLADAYHDYGFAYCFTRSLIDKGIDKPASYSEEEIARVLKAIKADETAVPQKTPNIVMVQLESYFDVNYLKNLRFSEDPVPVLSALKDRYAHGLLTVPSIGAGTANTEFEVLTGMSLYYFGAGEYPYKTVLGEKTCESVCYNLAELGYTNHAIHNHQGTFYERHEVFPNLGFDTFTSLEYMSDVEYTPTGWAKDNVLTSQVIQALSSTEGQDFVYAISVQAHGKYPNEAVSDYQKIEVEGLGNEEDKYAYEYFVNQVHETDAFIGELITELEAIDEPVVLVFFGDHLPSLGINNDDLSNENRFATEYVIWSNYGLAAESKDITSYQLYAHVLKQLNINNGILTKLHQDYSDQNNYQETLELLEYDMVCGMQIAYGGESPHSATDMRMGTRDIVVTGLQRTNESVTVTGEGFTEWSQVLIDGEQVDTKYVNNSTLAIAVDGLEPGAEIVVAQVCRHTLLSQTPRFLNDLHIKPMSMTRLRGLIAA